jgi:hypothetical protein
MILNLFSYITNKINEEYPYLEKCLGKENLNKIISNILRERIGLFPNDKGLIDVIIKTLLTERNRIRQEKLKRILNE